MNKTILITGSTDGIGRLAAKKLAIQGHNIYLHGRNKDKLEQALAEVKAVSNNENVKGFLADLSEFDAVRSLAKEVTSELEHIDVLINNAGVFHSPQPTNELGIDLRFMVNYLAPVWLTEQLIEPLKRGEGNILNLSSAAQAPVNLEAMKGLESISVNESYAQSKLAITMWSFFLSQKHPDLFISAINPGSLLNTRMVQEAYGHHWSPADKGADILVDLALTKTPGKFNGKYFDNDKGSLSNAHPEAYDKVKVSELICETKKLLKSLSDDLRVGLK